MATKCPKKVVFQPKFLYIGAKFEKMRKIT